MCKCGSPKGGGDRTQGLQESPLSRLSWVRGPCLFSRRIPETRDSPSTSRAAFFRQRPEKQGAAQAPLEMLGERAHTADDRIWRKSIRK